MTSVRSEVALPGLVLPPGPPDSPMNLVACRRNPLAFIRHVASFGDIAHVRLGAAQIYVVTHPDLIEDIMLNGRVRFGPSGAFPGLGNGLLSSVGPYHKQQRRLIQPAFHRHRLALQVADMATMCERVADGWSDGQEIDVLAEMTDLTFAVMMKSLFGTVPAHHDVARLQAAAGTIGLLNGQGGGLFGQVSREAALSNEAFVGAMDFVNRFIYDMVGSRRARGGNGDILSMMVEARYEDGTGMTDGQLRDETAALLGAAYGTISNGLTWTFYALAQHPHIWARLQEEADRILDGESVRPDHLPAFDLTTKALSESFRLYPPVPLQSPRALEEVEVGGYAIPAGTPVMLPQWVVHRDPRWWPRAEVFDPDRWTEQAEKARPRFAYFPFGGGPRLCIGESYAWMEAKVILATIARRWNLRLTSDPRVSTAPWTFLRPTSPIRIELSARDR